MHTPAARSRLALAAVVLALAPACDSSSFTPPRPPELSGAPAPPTGPPSAPSAATTPGRAETPAPARSRLVELILSQPNADRLFLAQFLRRDTGLKRCAFRLTVPESGQSFSAPQLAAAIRSAAGRSTGAIIVEPIDDQEVRKALSDARAKGVAVVLLDRTLPTSSPGTSFPYATLTGFEQGGKEVVAAVTDDAKLFKFPPEARIVVLENRTKDLHSQRRLDALTSALKAAGCPFDLLSFDGEQKGAHEALSEYLKTHKLCMVFGDDEYGLSGAFQLLAERHTKGKREFLIGGFAACDARLDEYVKGGSQGLVNRNTEGFARKLLALALDQMDQKPVPERNEVEMPFIHTPPPFKPTEGDDRDPLDARKKVTAPSSEPALTSTPESGK
jgi:ABC-type sugar transport system substrate-binding protein